MHPRYKTHYFKKESWLDKWIDEAISLTREIWITHYRDSMPLSLSTSAAPANTSTSTGVKVCRLFSPYHHLLYPSFHIISLSLIERDMTSFVFYKSSLNILY